MKRTIIAIFLISLIPVSTSAQLPNPEIQWTADWNIEDEVAIMQLNEDTYSFELIAGQAADASREIEMDLKFSKIYNLVVKYEDDGVLSSDAKMPMKSGTTKEINLRASNYGNTDDAVKETSISVSRCPQLDYSFEPSRELPIVVPPGVYTDDGTTGIVLGTLEVSTTTSHPSKECIVEFTIYPESESVSSYATLTIDVESVETIQAEPDDNTDDTGNTEATDLDVESSSLPALSSFLCTLAVLFSAVIRRDS